MLSKCHHIIYKSFSIADGRVAHFQALIVHSLHRYMQHLRDGDTIGDAHAHQGIDAQVGVERVGRLGAQCALGA